MSTTITDKENFYCNIIDKTRYEFLSVDDKKYFEGIRNSILEIFPNNNGIFGDETIKFAENLSFILLPQINNMIDTKLKIIETNINNNTKLLIETSLLSVSNSTTSTETTN